MAQIPDEITKIVKHFLNLLQQQQKISAVYLYGSYVKGTANEWSDIDLAIISPDFSNDLFEEQIKLMKLAAKIDDRIEPRPFIPQDFISSEPLVSEIQKTGVQIA